MNVCFFRRWSTNTELFISPSIYVLPQEEVAKVFLHSFQYYRLALTQLVIHPEPKTFSFLFCQVGCFPCMSSSPVWASRRTGSASEWTLESPVQSFQQHIFIHLHTRPRIKQKASEISSTISIILLAYILSQLNFGCLWRQKAWIVVAWIASLVGDIQKDVSQWWWRVGIVGGGPLVVSQRIRGNRYPGSGS